MHFNSKKRIKDDNLSVAEADLVVISEDNYIFDNLSHIVREPMTMKKTSSQNRIKEWKQNKLGLPGKASYNYF